MSLLDGFNPAAAQRFQHDTVGGVTELSPQFANVASPAVEQSSVAPDPLTLG